MFKKFKVEIRFYPLDKEKRVVYDVRVARGLSQAKALQGLID